MCRTFYVIVFVTCAVRPYARVSVVRGLRFNECFCLTARCCARSLCGSGVQSTRSDRGPETALPGPRRWCIPMSPKTPLHSDYSQHFQGNLSFRMPQLNIKRTHASSAARNPRPSARPHLSGITHNGHINGHTPERGPTGISNLPYARPSTPGPSAQHHVTCAGRPCAMAGRAHQKGSHSFLSACTRRLSAAGVNGYLQLPTPCQGAHRAYRQCHSAA